MWCVLPALAIGAVAADLHWERLPEPPGGLRDAAHGMFLVARSNDGSLYLWDDGWQLHAPPTPTSRTAERLAAGLDGSVWVYDPNPAVAQRFRTTWEERESLPIADVTALVTEADGTTWASGLFGQAARRGLEWERLEGLGEDHLSAVLDPTGGVWFFSDEGDGRALHRGAGKDRSIETGMPVWSSAEWAYAVGDAGEPQILPGRALALAEGHQWSQTDEVARNGKPMPLPTHEMAALWTDPEVGAFAWADGELYASRPGDDPVWVPGPEHWSVTRYGPLQGAESGDLNGDGWDDLVVRRVDGQLHALLQRSWGWDARAIRRVADSGPMALCDVDGNGRDDVVAYSDPTSLTLIRSLPGWFESTPLPSVGDVGKGYGLLTCADLDGDGDPDIAAAGGGHPQLNRRVALLLNDGLGHFTAAELPADGIASDSYTYAVLPGDLDGDGNLDLVLVNHWGRGHTLLYRDGDRFEDRSLGSGVDLVYDVVRYSALADLDGDGTLDLTTVGDGVARTWPAVGTGARALIRDDPDSWLAGHVADFDLDGVDEVLSASEGGWRMDGRDTVLPSDPPGPFSVLDLGHDGDLDIVHLEGSTPPWILPGAADARPAPVARSGGIPRALVWVRPIDLVALAVLVVALAWALRTAQRSGSNILLGNRPAIGLAGLFTVGAWLAFLESPPLARAALAAIGVVILPIAGQLEAVTHQRRTARRVGTYQLGAQLGRGGMGTVYLATDTDSGTVVALKLVHPELVATEADLAAYRREAELGASIDDAHVIRILGFGEYNAIDGLRPTTTAYLVMEFVDGGTLRDLLHREGTLVPGAAADLVRQAALGLRAVHASGVVHRDIKPENIAIPRTGGLKLMDFGAASRFSATATATDVLGTLGYVAPEQARGQAPSPASDIYSLGVVLYELLCGHRPHDADDIASLIIRVLERDPPPLDASVPDVLRELVARMLARDPDDRPTAGEVAKTLEPWAKPVLWELEARRTTDRSPGPATVRSHAGNLMHLLRLYYAYFRDGGRADLGEFALKLLTPPTNDEDIEPTRKRDD